MKDREMFSCDEFNIVKEQKNSYQENYAPLEEIPTKESFSLQENNEENQTIAESKPAATTIKFKDRIVESTAPIRTIVSAATCTVAATVVTLSAITNPIPEVKDVNLICGNDYVEYNLNLEYLDPDASYKLEVSNPNFYYTTDIYQQDLDILKYVEGYVNGLTPDRKYDFKLLRDNGEIGGYSAFYSESFYTPKASDPKAFFQFDLEETSLNYEIEISDYYNTCDSIYYVYTINGNDSNPMPIEDKSYTGTLSIDSNSSISFKVIGNIGESEFLLGEYTYYLNSFEVTYEEDTLRLKGHVSDEYKNLATCFLEFYTYDENNEFLESTSIVVKDVMDINETFTPFLTDYETYSYRIYTNNLIIYESEVFPNIGTRILFGDQTLTEEGLSIIATDLPEEVSGYVVDKYGHDVPLIFLDQSFLIPFYDAQGNAIEYDDYSVIINNRLYDITPDNNLLYLQDVELYIINSSIYISTNRILCVNKQAQRLKAEIYLNDTLLGTSYVEENSSILTDISPDNIGDIVSIQFTMVNDQDQAVTDTITQDSVRIKDNISLNQTYTKPSLEIFINSTESYQVRIKKYDVAHTLISSTDQDFNGNNYYTEDLTENVGFVIYEILSNKKVIYTSNEYEMLHITFTGQAFDSSGIVIYANGVNKDLTGTIVESSGTSLALRFREDCIIIPYYNNQYENVFYTDYTMTITNGFDSVEVIPTIENAFEIKDIYLENDYNYNGLSFNAYAVQDTSDYVLVVEAYQGDTLENKEEVSMQNINRTIHSFYGYNISSNLASDTTFKLYLKETNTDVVLTDVYEYTILSKDKSGTFTCNYPNPMDVLVTHNEDGTINMYIPINFSSDDPDIFVRLYLNDEIIDTRDKVVFLENYEDTSYGIVYRVMKKSTSLDMVLNETTVSGVINEGEVFLYGDLLEENGKRYITVDVTNYVNNAYDASKCYFEDHENATYNEIDCMWKVEITDIENSVIFHMVCSIENSDNSLTRVLEVDPNTQIKGSIAKEWIIEIVI